MPDPMPDAFDDLRAPTDAVAPDPDFAVRLRERVERALALPRGVAPVTEQRPEESALPQRGIGAAVPYLAADGARRAIDWYVDVFGARVVGEPIVMPDGRIGHSELVVSGGWMYLADAHPEIGVTAPRPNESPVSLMIAVDDADAVRARAVAAGASADREPYAAHGQRNAWIVDPFGHRWGLNSPLRAAPAHRTGDVTHVSLRTPDAARAADFYTAVLGWRIEDDRVPAAVPSVGVWTADEPTLLCVFAVDDVEAAAERVVAAGGTVEGTRREPYGLRADCTDDQGVAFSLHEVGVSAGRPAPPSRAGDLSYLTLLVADSARTRAFYGEVLGWEFTPGRIDDGWEVRAAAPLIGISGGHEQARAVPMWTVPDIAAAVDEVRAHGGTATDPEQQPYGAMSECTDDQGSPFYLGEF